jgi:aminoglycoside 3-N-acetyltransferase
MSTVTAPDIRAGVRRLGLAGKAVCLHSSLSSFGTVTDGADDVVDAFLAEGCTLIVPSFSWRFAALPSKDLRPTRNAWDYEQPRALESAPPTYSPETTEIDRRMGAIPAGVVSRPGRERGAHPLCSFTALGPEAAEAVAAQTWDDVYAPLRWLTDNNGTVLLAGVGLTSMTFLHYAEQLAGRALFRRWVLDADGNTQMVPVGGCSNGFEALAPFLAPFAKSTLVGTSSWVAYPASTTLLATLVRAVRDHPEVTRCADLQCDRCRDSIAGGPLL